MTLSASLCPLVVTGSYFSAKEREICLLDFFFIVLAALGIQIFCNWCNDYYDYVRGTDDPSKRLGPVRALQQQSLSQKEFLRGIYWLFFGLLLIFCYIFAIYGWIFFSILMISLLMAYLYTGSNYSLSYHGLGEIMAFLFFGPVIVLTSAAILAKGEWIFDRELLIFSLFCGLFSLSLIIVNNYRDRESDSSSKKRTTAVLFGDHFCRILYSLNAVILIAIPLVWGHLAQKKTFLLPLLASPLLISNIIFLFSQKKEQMNILLKKTGKTYVIYTFFIIIATLTTLTAR